MNPGSQKGRHAMFQTTPTMLGGHSFPTTSMPTKLGTGRAVDLYPVLSLKTTMQVMKQTR